MIAGQIAEPTNNFAFGNTGSDVIPIELPEAGSGTLGLVALGSMLALARGRGRTGQVAG